MGLSAGLLLRRHNTSTLLTGRSEQRPHSFPTIRLYNKMHSVFSGLAVEIAVWFKLNPLLRSGQRRDRDKWRRTMAATGAFLHETANKPPLSNRVGAA